MPHTTFDAALTWEDDALSFLPEHRHGMNRRVRLEETADAAFGLLEVDAGGWTLCIPDGARASAAVGERELDLSRVRLEPSGERRLPLCAGLSARIDMGTFRFELRPAAA